MPLRLYLADLTHTGLGVATEAFPLNIGLAASYAKKRFGGQVEISLFKYPQELEEALRRQPPHLLGCSNYTWNSWLAYHFVKLAKSLNPDVLTLFGGTNYPFDAENQRRFLARRPQLDLHLYYEGELAFAEVLERMVGTDQARWREEPIDGCQFLDRATGQLRAGRPLERIKELDSIPSPYASGLLDRFFDGKLTPLMETARGCPFTCNFCNAGASYFTKVNQFSPAYVREEWEYVARRASQAGVGHLTLADNNFGMLPRDTETAQLMHDLQGKYGWPRSVTAWTGKNSKKQVLEVTRLLGDTLVISMAVQSLDPEVLKNIARSNIRLEDYRAIADELNAQGRPQMGEMICPLPGDTWDSFLRGVRDLLDANVSTVIVHTLQMLHGTPYKDDPEYIRQFGFVRKYRLVPLDFGSYGGTPVFDTEEVAVATRTFSEQEYVQSRVLLLLIDLCYNGKICAALKKHLTAQGLKMSAWIEELYRRIGDFPPAVRALFDDFSAETLGELWGSEEELLRHYAQPENYQKLVRGEAGGNVLFKHKTRMMSEAGEEWIHAVFAATRRMLKPETAEELADLERFTLCSVAGAFNLQETQPLLVERFRHDIPAWLKDAPAVPLSRYRSEEPVELRFSFDPEQQVLRREACERYGSHLSGIVKWIQRLAGVQRLTRHVSYGTTHVPRHDGLKRVLG